MKNGMRMLAVLAVVITAVAVPSLAQPGGQPYVFYSEEPWGGGSYLGVDTRDVTPDRLSALHLKEEHGVEVTMVDQDAPAGKAAVKEHDVILSINNQAVESVEQLRRMIHEIPAGRTIDIGISRDGQLSTLKAQLVERNKTFGSEREFDWGGGMPPVNTPAIAMPKLNIPDMENFQTVVVMRSPSRSGLMVENLTPQLGDFFGVKSGNGVLVRSVEKGSRAEQAGFHAGDVVVKVNGSAVNDCSDFTRLLKGRAANKATVTVLRDRKEQNITITLPEAKRSGAVPTESKCEDTDMDMDDEACASIVEVPELALLAPEMATAELKRLQPQLDQLKKQVQIEVQNHRVEIQKDLEKAQKELLKNQVEIQNQRVEINKQIEKAQKDLIKQQKEMKIEIKTLVRDADI
jgi:membrane-associated protease RseP (regulator of RpoE activity)